MVIARKPPISRSAIMLSPNGERTAFPIFWIELPVICEVPVFSELFTGFDKFNRLPFERFVFDSLASDVGSKIGVTEFTGPY